MKRRPRLEHAPNCVAPRSVVRTRWASLRYQLTCRSCGAIATHPIEETP
jgi:hypothetical protein